LNKWNISHVLINIAFLNISHQRKTFRSNRCMESKRFVYYGKAIEKLKSSMQNVKKTDRAFDPPIGGQAA
jgi:hypothetical protein